MSDILVRFSQTLGAFKLHVEFTAPGNACTCLLGPSGSGKTSLLRAVAGLSQPEKGLCIVNAQRWHDSTTGLFLPPQKRKVGYVFQDGNLFPHLSVRGNLEFGWKRVAKSERLLSFDNAVQWFGLENLLSRSVSTLSGGEIQRVAIARAVLASPELLLMDEPLASLDPAARSIILSALETLRAELSIPIFYVTHAIDEAARLADRIVWLQGGRIQAIGGPTELLGRGDLAASLHDQACGVADATVVAHDEDYHLSELQCSWGQIWTRQVSGKPGRKLRLAVHASDVSLGLRPEPESSIQNEMQMRIHSHIDAGEGRVLVSLLPLSGEPSPLPVLITKKSWDKLQLRQDKQVYARIKSVKLLEH